MDQTQKPLTILVVEDEPLIRMDLVDLIEEAGFHTLEARNADDALAIVEGKDGFQVLFTDVDMPGSIDGLELARIVAGQRPDVRIIITSGQTVPTDDEMPAGAVFLPKPHEASRLADVLQPGDQSNRCSQATALIGSEAYAHG
ncbi:response regulator, partial [Camelimonas fluminis]